MRKFTGMQKASNDLAVKFQAVTSTAPDAASQLIKNSVQQLTASFMGLPSFTPFLKRNCHRFKLLCERNKLSRVAHHYR